MTWPTDPVDTSALDAGTDTPPRATFFSWAQKFNQLVAHVTGYMQGLLASADAAAARTTLDVPSRSGSGASGTWGISIGGNAGSATNSAQLGGVAASGYTKSSGTSELGNVARTSGDLPGGFTGGMQARNAGTGAGTATFYDAVLGGVTAGGVQFLRNSDGSVEARIGRTPAGDPAVDRRVYDLILRGDGILTGPGFLPTGGAGAIGYPALLFSRSLSITTGSTYAGSGLRAQGMTRAADSVLTTPDSSGPVQTGTWLALSTIGVGGYGCLAQFIRIS